MAINTVTYAYGDHSRQVQTIRLRAQRSDGHDDDQTIRRLRPLEQPGKTGGAMLLSG